jgi:hypothetical protein
VAKARAAARIDASPLAGIIPFPGVDPARSVRAQAFGFHLVHVATLRTDHGPKLVSVGTVSHVESDAEAESQ